MIAFDRWHQIKELFCDALEIAPQDRPDFLDARCADDRDLRTQVEALLTSRARAGVFLEGSAAVDFDSMSDALAASLVGQRLGRYQIKGLIGRGAYGALTRPNENRTSFLVPIHRFREMSGNDRVTCRHVLGAHVS